MSLRAPCAALALGLAAAVFGLPPIAHALPAPEAPRAKPTASPSATPPNPKMVLVGAPIDFVLDDSISSGKARSGEIVHLHLREALVVNGMTLAHAGTPATLKILNAHRATAGDNDGSLQIAIAPLELIDHKKVPIRANHEYLTIEHSRGQLTTRTTTDTITDIFLPGAVIYNAFRKGRDFVLPVGAILRAQLAATIDASDPSAISIIIPRPTILSNDVPHADFSPAPFFTAQPPPPKKTPAPKHTSTPRAAPTGSP